MKWVIAFVAAVGLCTVIATVWFGSRVAESPVVRDPYQAGLDWDAAQRRARQPDCALSAGPCTAAAGGRRVTLDVTPRPLRAMTEVDFTVEVEPPVAGATGEILLTMPGMYMGDNRVRVAPASDGRLHGRGVFVRCASGRRVWSAEVRIHAPDAAANAAANAAAAVFTFELAE